MSYDNLKGMGDYEPPEQEPQFEKFWLVKIESCIGLKYDNPELVARGTYDLADIKSICSAVNEMGGFEFINGCTCDLNPEDLDMVAEFEMVEI